MRADDEAFLRDQKLYTVIARHNVTCAAIPSAFEALFNDEVHAALRHGMRKIELVGFEAPDDTRDDARRQSDAALLTAIRKRE
jgi:hypothetical protein